MNADDAHWNMSNLWERIRGCKATATSPRDKSGDDVGKYLDLQVLSNPAVYAGKWDPRDPQSWPAGRIFLLRPRINKGSNYNWRRSNKPRAGIFRALSLRLQTNIIGLSRGLRPKPYNAYPKKCMHAYHIGTPGTRHDGHVPGPA